MASTRKNVSFAQGNVWISYVYISGGLIFGSHGEPVPLLNPNLCQAELISNSVGPASPHLL